MDRRALAPMVPALRADLRREPGRPGAQRVRDRCLGGGPLKAEAPRRRTVVLCTDVSVHRLWVAEGTDLFLVTSPAAPASVRRFLPRAATAVVPPRSAPPSMPAPSQEEARQALGVPLGEPCVLVIDSGWGFGRLVESVSALAAAGVHVLAVAGRQRAVERAARASR